IYNRTDLYPADTSLNGIDNITVSDGGDVLVAEDSDDNQIQVLTPGGELLPLLQLTGHSIGNLPGELTGPAFDPSGTRLYFSSQRGTLADFQAQGRLIGVTFEISGPFLV
ncbi:MAG: PhoX family protein, partial [Gammaproteobacteria bacterium]|nr:PhoX family protein [Gammaproteobacteria bacterium]